MPPLPHPGPLSTFRYSDPSAVRVWFLAEEGGRSTPIWLHDVLLKNGAFDIRWFSSNEWKARADGAELPY